MKGPQEKKTASKSKPKAAAPKAAAKAATLKAAAPKAAAKAAAPKAAAKAATLKAAAPKTVVRQRVVAPKTAAKQTSEARSGVQKGMRGGDDLKSFLEQMKVEQQRVKDQYLQQKAKAQKDLKKSIPEPIKTASPRPTEIMKPVAKPKKAASSTRKIVVKEFRANTDFNDIDGLVKAARTGATCHLILGIDADQVDEPLDQGIAGIVDWLSKFQDRIGKADPHVFAATVFVLDRPEHDNARLGEVDVDRLIEAGACFREKREKYYKPDVDFAAALRKDLSDTGVISSEDEETLSMAQSLR